MMLNWVSAIFHSFIGIVHFFEMLVNAKWRSFNMASSLGERASVFSYSTFALDDKPWSDEG
jgi:uncharacterized membrane protein YjjB (DUF3815 family)